MFRSFWFWIIVLIVCVLVLFFGSFVFGVSIHKHHGSATVGAGGSTATLGVSGGHTQTITTSSGTVTVTTPSVVTAPAAVPGNETPWPGPQNGPTAGTNIICSNGGVRVVVDLNDVVHDGEAANFGFIALNCTGRTIQFSRAALALGLDGMSYMQVPVTDLSDGFDYLGADGSWIATGSLAPGQQIVFTGKVQVPVRGLDGWRAGATLACLKGDLQVVYVGKPNATAKADNVSNTSCSEFNAS